jgi:hypothetical protein
MYNEYVFPAIKSRAARSLSNVEEDPTPTRLGIIAP